jgi:hypothetical protein
MIQNRTDVRSIEERLDYGESLDRAVRDGVPQVLRRHMLLGESVVVADEHGKPQTRGPEETRRVLENDKSDSTG